MEAQSTSLPLVRDVPDCCLSVIFPAIYEIWSLEWCIFRSWNLKFPFNATFSSSVEYGVHLQMAYTNALPYFTHFLNVKHLWDSAHHQLASYIHLTEMIPHYFIHFFFNNICTLNCSLLREQEVTARSGTLCERFFFCAVLSCPFV